jgi:hypothetical protein
MLDLRNKVYALLHLHRYEDAILLSDNLIEFRGGDSETDFHFSGLGNWLIGNWQQAIAVWEKAKNALYKDAAGGINTQVFLYFAGVKMSNKSLKYKALASVRKILKSKRSTNWPGPIGNFLVGDINETELLSHISSAPILRERQLCQANFVIGVKLLDCEDRQGYYAKLKEVIALGVPSYVEKLYYLAKGELEESK